MNWLQEGRGSRKNTWQVAGPPCMALGRSLAESRPSRAGKEGGRVGSRIRVRVLGR